MASRLGHVLSGSLIGVIASAPEPRVAHAQRRVTMSNEAHFVSRVLAGLNKIDPRSLVTTPG